MTGREILARIEGIPAVLTGRDDVWLVGGAVRDVLLGREPRELDFVVEGDAVAVARRLGEPVVHERFGTATVAGVDLASARTETYPWPGALPEVRLGATAREDLARRDFTVNAMAVRLSDGELIEWPGAREDLAAGVLRVLHDASFVDDPTRLLRLARYAARLGFTVDPHTQILAAGAELAPAGPSRLGEELRLLLGEPLPAALEQLSDLGLGQSLLGPSFRVERTAIEKASALTGTEIQGTVPFFSAVALAVSLVAAPAGAVRARLDELGFPAAERDAVAAAAEGATELGRELERLGGGPPSAIWFLLRRRPDAVVAAAGAVGGRAAFAAAQRWFSELRDARPAVTGDDFVAAGLSGPAVGEALARATAAYLDGSAPDRESQLAAGLASEP